MTNLQSLIEDFNELQALYKLKRERLDNWKDQSQQLEQEVKRLMMSFEQYYEQWGVSGKFEDEIKEKLNNRREGIRLSVKSVNRLFRKLNPEKSLEAGYAAFIFEEGLADRLSISRWKALKEGVLQDPPLHLEKDGACKESVGDVKVDKAVGNKDAKVPAGEQEYLEFTLEQGANTVHNVIEEIILFNRGIVDELDSAIETAEKRFVTFMEKGVAPIMDGLYSGKHYAMDLTAELREAGYEQLEKVEEWLMIYNVLLSELQVLFDQFAVTLFAPAVGDIFDEYHHDPIGVVEDFNYQNEQIKEVVRYGLLYKKMIFNQNAFLIRPAQVIVVKNKVQNIIEEQRGTSDESGQ
ncbi:nucleotide exchange factor GrpE [Ectobacillus funiculus]|uniref:Nucleotide exchange factor GrpE n=1 Tax=Ectobacillus funiculus TaxID=137993 RepID=A0ABV5WEJ7_9BACI